MRSSGVKEKVARNAKRSRFDISLSHIPPEVEEKLWVRLLRPGNAGAEADPGAVGAGVGISPR
jgi:hypothetical protein